MKKLILIAAFGFAFSAVPAFAGNPEVISGRVESVTDGDTFILDSKRIRLWGIQAPEMDEDGGHASKWHLSRLIQGKKIKCLILDTDRYSRFVAMCNLDNFDIARLQVMGGYAADWPWYSGGFYKIKK